MPSKTATSSSYFECNDVDEMCNVDRSPHLFAGLHQSELEAGFVDTNDPPIAQLYPTGTATACLEGWFVG